MENENVILARDIMDGKRKAKTRQIYHTRIEVLTKWIKDNHPMSYDLTEGHLRLPLDPALMMEFMAKVSTIEDKQTKEKKQVSISVISSYAMEVRYACCLMRVSSSSTTRLY